MSELLTPMQAARVAGVSYPTIKQWIYKGGRHASDSVWLETEFLSQIRRLMSEESIAKA